MCAGVSKYRDGGLRGLIGRYAESDSSNPILSSIIAGICKSYGLNNDSVAMSLEIIEGIKDNTSNLMDRNILVWNLYRLIKEYIDDGDYDRALELCSRAELNWSRNVILGDDIGAYHVSWIEQLWLRRAQIYMLQGKESEFQVLTDRILLSRLELFHKAWEATGEGIIKDKCTFSCFELMAFQAKKRDYDSACRFLKHAMRHKAGNFDLSCVRTPHGKLKHGYFEELLKVYYRMPDVPYDNIRYGYCRSCRYFDGISACESHRINTDKRRACDGYEFKS